MDDFDNEPVENWQPGAAITPELFQTWRAARRGERQGEVMTNPVWEWLVRTRISASTAAHHFGQTSFGAPPGWCFQRFGQSRTMLPDGRTLFIAGEHEDHYDPSFFIYNDVVITHPDGSLEIRGYPVSEFPPTDFHSATLLGDRLILTGNLGYQGEREAERTQVLSLDVSSLRIQQLETQGESPGWISRHSSELTSDGIIVRGGKIALSHLRENIDDWLLNPESLRWTRLTDRQWPQFHFERQDGETNRLWEIRSAETWKSIEGGELSAAVSESMKSTRELLEMLRGPIPSLEGLDQLYRPPVDHEVIPRDPENFEEHNFYRIKIREVAIRYVEEAHAVKMTVEGSLSESILKAITCDLRDKLAKLEGAAYEVRQL